MTKRFSHHIDKKNNQIQASPITTYKLIFKITNSNIVFLPTTPKILAKSFFCRPAEVVAPELVGCLIFKRQQDDKVLWGVIVETEAYSQIEEGCHGYKRRSKSNESLFGEPGILYTYLTYGVHHCVNVVTGQKELANGVLLRSLAIPNEDERIASGPGLLAKRLSLNLSHDSLPLSIENGIWITCKPSTLLKPNLVSTTRIGISKAKDLKWRWYLHSSRSVSKRSQGDRQPSLSQAWIPSASDLL